MLGLRRRRPDPVDPGAVVFVPPRAGRGRADKPAFDALIGLVYAGWGVYLAFNGQPVLGTLSVLVWVELFLLRLRVARTGVVGTIVRDDELAARVAPPLRELCQRAGVAAPRVMLRSDSARAAAVWRVRGGHVLQLSCPFVRSVDDAALRAILAHEVVHIVHGDTRAAWRRTLVALFTAGIASGLTGSRLSDVTDLPIWMTVFIFTLLAVLAALAPTNQPREVQADVEGARLCADPAALARALQAARALSEEARRRLLGPPPLRVLLLPVSWRPRTHPPMEERLARLEAMAGRVSSGW